MNTCLGKVDVREGIDVHRDWFSVPRLHEICWSNTSNTFHFGQLFEGRSSSSLRRSRGWHGLCALSETVFIAVQLTAPWCLKPLTLIPGGDVGSLKRHEIFFIAWIVHKDEDDEKVDANLAKKPKPACLWWTLEEILSRNSKFILGWLIGLPLSGSIPTSLKGSTSKRGSWHPPCSDHSRCMIQSHAGSQNCMVQVELRIPKCLQKIRQFHVLHVFFSALHEFVSSCT